jgi:hypothetical protein
MPRAEKEGVVFAKFNSGIRQWKLLISTTSLVTSS